MDDLGQIENGSASKDDNPDAIFAALGITDMNPIQSPDKDGEFDFSNMFEGETEGNQAANLVRSINKPVKHIGGKIIDEKKETIP